MADRGRPRRFDRQEALRRAMEVFWAKGFDNASLADLTSAMGLNSPSLYAAFRNKEELFKEAINLYAESAGDGIWNQVPLAPTARDAIEGLLRRTAEAFTRGSEPRGCLIVLAAPQNEGAHPAICDELKSRRMETIAILQERLERAVADGELPLATNSSAIANYVVTLQHGMSIQARDGASRETLLAIADCAMAGWHGLVTQQSPP
jgi:AcrR family transcriptional regulator